MHTVSKQSHPCIEHYFFTRVGSSIYCMLFYSSVRESELRAWNVRNLISIDVILQYILYFFYPCFPIAWAQYLKLTLGVRHKDAKRVFFKRFFIFFKLLLKKFIHTNLQFISGFFLCLNLNFTDRFFFENQNLRIHFQNTTF